MDVGSLLAEAADETYDGDDFEGQGDQTPPTTRQTAAEILKLSAGEVARNDKVETAKILQKESENINRTEKARKEVRDSSADSSPERDGQSDLISSSLRNATETVHASDGRRNEAAHDHMYIDEGSEIALQDSDDEGDDNENDADDDDSGADPELDTELLVASYQGNIRKVVKLMGSGARYFARDRHKWTALMWAAAGGYDDIIDSIVSFVKKSKVKSFINAKDGITGWTALHIACTRGRRKCAQALVRLGAKKNSLSYLKETPLDCLTASNADDRRIITDLLRGRSKVSSTSGRSESKDYD